MWQAFYAQRWNVSARQQAPGSWQAVYSRKLQLANHLYGSCSHDILRGHKQAARCVSLSPSQGLLASGTHLQVLRPVASTEHAPCLLLTSWSSLSTAASLPACLCRVQRLHCEALGSAKWSGDRQQALSCGLSAVHSPG